MAKDKFDAYNRGLTGKSLSHWTEALIPSTPEECAAYEHGRIERLRLDEQDRRVIQRVSPEPIPSWSDIVGCDGSASSCASDEPSPARHMPLMDTAPMPYEFTSEAARLGERWTVGEFVNTWNRFVPQHPIDDLPRFHAAAERFVDGKRERDEPRLLTLEDFTTGGSTHVGIITSYFSFKSNKRQRMGMFFGGHHRRLRELIRAFIRLGATK